VFVNGVEAETSHVTRETAEALLEDPELIEIFEALIDFTNP